MMQKALFYLEKGLILTLTTFYVLTVI